MTSGGRDRADVASLAEEAATRVACSVPTGPVPFGDNLERLLRSCWASGRLNATGSQVLHKACVRHLGNLLRLDAFVAARPEVRQRSLGRPVVITGLPRTGTTLLHNLLALDPTHRVVRLWEALRLVGAAADGPTEETLVAQADRWLDSFYRMIPEFRRIHPATASGPEECDALLQNAFASQHFDDMFDAEEYSAWLAEAPLRDEYEHYALQLRVLSVASAGGEGPAWVLKSPSHLGHVDALRAALPDCTVVVCHRHPYEAVASYASLIHTLRQAYYDAVSPAVVGAQALRRAATAMQRAQCVRDAAGDEGFLDVSYPAMVRDPVGSVAALYGRLERSLDAGVAAAMAGWVADNPAGRHGPHGYDLARFGLTETDVDAAFAPYLERFGTMVEG